MVSIDWCINISRQRTFDQKKLAHYSPAVCLFRLRWLTAVSQNFTKFVLLKPWSPQNPFLFLKIQASNEIIWFEMAYCTLRNGTSGWYFTKRNEICTLQNENLYFAKWKSVLCEMKICTLRNENLYSPENRKPVKLRPSGYLENLVPRKKTFSIACLPRIASKHLVDRQPVKVSARRVAWRFCKKDTRCHNTRV